MMKHKKEMCTIVILLLLLFACNLHESLANGSAAAEMVPVVEQGKAALMMMMLDDSRRKLNSFQICAMCTCCGGDDKNYCMPSPCCYAINCNIPNRPFGFCAFTPKTCNCFGCQL